MKIVGHRGAKGLAPENTVASLLKAIEHGVDEVEFDVRVTRDGAVILRHDPTIRDHSGKRLKVADQTLQQLRTYKSDLATLDEASQAIQRQVPMVVELKPGINCAPVFKVLKTLLGQGWQPTDIVLISRSSALLRQARQALPDVERGIIDSWSGVRATWHARRLGAKRLYMNQLWLWPGFIRSVSRGGWQLYAYALNDPAKAKRWAAHGLAGVETDYPDRFES